MSVREETRLLAYSATRSVPSLSQNGINCYFNRDEAWQHAIRYIGMRTTSADYHPFEIKDVYVGGDEEQGVIMAVWESAS